MEEFSIYSMSPTNEDISITYNPNSSVNGYTYTIYKDNEEFKTINVEDNSNANILLSENGEYYIEVLYKNENDETVTNTSGKYIIDKEAPKLEVGSVLINMKQGYELDLFGDVTAKDNRDGDLSSKVTTNYEELNLDEIGLHKLIYTVSDEAGNTSRKVVNINVLENNENQLLAVQTGIIFVLLAIVMLIISYRRSINLEKRISKYSIDSKKDTKSSLFDNISRIYQKYLQKVSSVLEKSVFIKKYAKRYEKYVMIFDKVHKTGIDYVSTKLIVGVVFLLITIFSKTVHYDILRLYEMCFPIIFGFFIPDILYFSKYKLHRRRIENDLLQAIIVMNNAFKSGRSITQAIELVTTELDGPIADEFMKMYAELNFGLEIDVVFKRFAERVEIEEVNYLTASLSILNKTGGNIIKVFSSIEKTLFNKKKLRLELESLTGSSKMLVYTLFAVPFLFIIMISIIDPTYFLPLLLTPVGIILTVLMVIYYIIYVLCVKSIMKVRM